MQPRYERLLETVHERTGDALRGVAAYDGDDVGVIYRRTDLDEQRFERAARVAAARVDRGDSLAPERRRASVELCDESVVVHIREGPERGVVLSLDPVVARQLGGFVDECTTALRASTSRFEADIVSADG